ncbi:MAG: HU family DNA-binding protein [Duncaniella sp.]|nr:HU family DNA-binding protein [Duncaniella sp.]
MDSKTFNSRLASLLKRNADETSTLTDALSKLLTETGSELDSIAIPGFGTFTTVKADESVITDTVTGKRTLMPPSITMTFQPSVVLRKKMSR